MPYTKDNPPDRIKKMPKPAKDIFVSAFNSALKQYKDEGKASAVAYAAVKKAGYHEDKDGNWAKGGGSEESLSPKETTMKEDYGMSSAPGTAVVDHPEPDEDDVKAAQDQEPDQDEMPMVHAHPHMHEGMEKKHEHLHSHDKFHEPDANVNHSHPHPDGMEMASKKPEANIAESKKLRTLYFSEPLSFSEAAVDKANGVIDVTVIKKGWSENNRYYSQGLLEKTYALLDGARAFGDHASLDSEKNLPERSIWEQIGYYTNPRVEGDKMKATLKLVGDQAKKEHVLEWADECIQSGKPLMGISINALGKTEMGEAEGKKGVIVSEIAAYNSADIVTRPAAGGGFNQIIASSDEFTAALLKNLEYEEWRSARPDFEARMKEEMRTARKDELDAETKAKLQESEQKLSEQTKLLETKDGEISKLTEEVNQAKKELTDKVSEYENRVSDAIADKKLALSKLPKELAASVKPQLVGKPPEEQDKLIEAERIKYFSVKEPVKVNNPRTEETLESIQKAKMEVVSRSLGTDLNRVPLPGENYEQWEARTKGR